MNPRHERHTETNTNAVSNSTVHHSAVVAGSHSTVTVNHAVGTAEEQEALAAVAQLRSDLTEALAALDRRDDEARESLQIVGVRLDGLEEELRAGPTGRDPERIKKLLTGICDTVAGLTGLITSADGLWAAVQSVVR